MDNKCFALSERGYCNILTIGKCMQAEGCSFFKTRERMQEEEERLRKRRRDNAGRK